VIVSCVQASRSAVERGVTRSSRILAYNAALEVDIAGLGSVPGLDLRIWLHERDGALLRRPVDRRRFGVR